MICTLCAPGAIEKLSIWYVSALAGVASAVPASRTAAKIALFILEVLRVGISTGEILTYSIRNTKHFFLDETAALRQRCYPQRGGHKRERQATVTVSRLSSSCGVGAGRASISLTPSARCSAAPNVHGFWWAIS